MHDETGYFGDGIGAHSRAHELGRQQKSSPIVGNGENDADVEWGPDVERGRRWKGCLRLFFAAIPLRCFYELTVTLLGTFDRYGKRGEFRVAYFHFLLQTHSCELIYSKSL